MLYLCSELTQQIARDDIVTAVTLFERFLFRMLYTVFNEIEKIIYISMSIYL